VKRGAYWASRSRRSLFELRVGSFLVEIARPFLRRASVLGRARRRLVKTVHVDLKLTGIH